MQWDLFCRVVDNLGDIGVCWRLAADLASRGERVRLWADDVSALDWMAPGGAAGVDVRAWADLGPDDMPGDVVIEAFGCDPAPAFVARMAAAPTAPVWINLEYLSAEPYVERSHGLPSPVADGPGRGLRKWFYYPGFTSRTGGLLREPGLLTRRAAFDARAWLVAQGLAPAPGERTVSVFCYDNPALDGLLDRLATVPTLLLATPGAPARQVQALLGDGLRRGPLRAALLPHLSQVDFDHLLWSCDLNLVRGEDSFVRAQWAGSPFVWQAYPQHDGAHMAKLEAFLGLSLREADAGLSMAVRHLWLAWNGAAAMPADLPELNSWARIVERWRERLVEQADLASQLTQFAQQRLQGNRIE